MQSTQSFFLEVFSVTLIWGVIFLVWWFLRKRSLEYTRDDSSNINASKYPFIIDTATDSVKPLPPMTFKFKNDRKDMLDQLKALESVDLQKLLCTMVADKFREDYYIDDYYRLWLTPSGSDDICKEFESFRTSLYASAWVTEHDEEV